MPTLPASSGVAANWPRVFINPRNLGFTCSQPNRPKLTAIAPRFLGLINKSNCAIAFNFGLFGCERVKEASLIAGRGVGVELCRAHRAQPRRCTFLHVDCRRFVGIWSRDPPKSEGARDQTDASYYTIPTCTAFRVLKWVCGPPVPRPLRLAARLHHHQNGCRSSFRVP